MGVNRKWALCTEVVQLHVRDLYSAGQKSDLVHLHNNYYGKVIIILVILINIHAEVDNKLSPWDNLGALDLYLAMSVSS